MDQKSINEEYKKFNIPNNMVPVYKDADQFSKSFQICSVLKEVNTTYSTTTIQQDNQQVIKKRDYGG